MGRLTFVEKLYEYAGEQPSPPDDAAGWAIMHLHPEILPQSMSLVLPEAAKLLLPPIKTYMSNISFEGTRDVRVLDHARTLRVAVWLHHLDMAVRGDQSASETLDASWHCLGHLIESFLVPTTHDLTFREVVSRCLYENRRDTEHRLKDLVKHRN